MSKRRSLIIGVVAAVVIAVVIFHVLRGQPDSLVLTGIVTTNDVQVGSMLQGRIDKLAVRPGDKVAKGDLIALILPQDQRASVAYYQSLQQAAKSAVEQSASQLQYSSSQTTQQIRQAEAELAVAQADTEQSAADLANAEARYKREQQVAKQHLSSAQALDAARTSYESAKAHHLSSQRHVEAARAALALANASKERIDGYEAALVAARKQLAAAQAETDKAQIQLGYTEVTAPISGIVDVRAALAGEVVNAGQALVTLIDPDDLWVRADVEESYIDQVRLGDQMQIRLPSGATRQCEVFFRGVDADYATQRDVSRTKRDIKTFEIRLRCDNRDRSLAVGMTAYVTLPLRQS